VLFRYVSFRPVTFRYVSFLRRGRAGGNATHGAGANRRRRCRRRHALRSGVVSCWCRVGVVLVSCWGRLLLCWDLFSVRCAHTLPKFFFGPYGSVASVVLCFSVFGCLFLSCFFGVGLDVFRVVVYSSPIARRSCGKYDRAHYENAHGIGSDRCEKAWRFCSPAEHGDGTPGT
jgi:hypothetical protein